MARSRTLITGVNGFTGRYLAAQLASQGHEVHGLVHSDASEQIPGVAALHRADLTDAARVAAAVSEIAPDRVAHLAAIAFVAHADVESMYHTNILGTRNLLEALANCAKSPQSVLLASSANIYGNAREGVLDESTPLAPANDYGVTKVALEYVAGLYRERLPLILARPFNYTGRGQSTDFIIPKIAAHVRRRSPEIELGNLDVSRDFSDVRVVVDAYGRLLDSPAAVGGTFNVCSGRAVSLKEVLDLFRELSGHQFTVVVNPAFVRANEVRVLCGTATRLEATIGPLNMPPFKDTLRWMLEG